MSDGSWSEPYAIANDLAIAAKNAAAKLRLGVYGMLAHASARE